MNVALLTPLAALLLSTPWFASPGEPVSGIGAATAALPHHPHDVVDDVVVTPGYPTDPTVFVASMGSMNLFLISRNRGFTWVNSRSGMRGYKVWESAVRSDWATSKTVYVAIGEGGLQRSSDGGRTWDPPLSKDDTRMLAITDLDADGHFVMFFGGPRGLSRSDDGGKTISSLPMTDLTALGVSPTHAADKTVAIGTQGRQVRVSRDGGSNWTDIDVGGVPQRIHFSPDFTRDRTIWVATHGAGVLRSTDGGASFQSVSKGIKDTDINDVHAAPNYPACKDVFVTTRNDGVYRSPDGGDTWALTGLAVDKTQQTDNHYRRLELSPHYPEDPTIYCGTFEGLYISLDRGATWYESNINPTRIGRKLEISPAFGSDQTLFVSTYGNPLMSSQNGGTTWDQRTIDFNSMSPYSLAVSPDFAHDKTVFVGVNLGIRRSTDGGATWASTDLKQVTYKPEFHSFETRAVVFSPNYAKDRTVYAASPGGIFKSFDAGATWSSHPVVADFTWVLAMSPNWTTDKTLWHAGLTLHRSVDDGATWSEPLLRDKVLAVLPDPDFAKTGEVYVLGRNRGFALSTDGGVTFTQTQAMFNGFAPASMRLSPTFQKDGTIWVTTLAGGLFASNDRGRTWKRVAPLGSPVDTCYEICISPDFAQDGTMFAGTYEGIWRTTDACKTWKLITDVELYDDARDPWMLQGNAWGGMPLGHRYSFGERRANKAGHSMTLPFTGTGVEVIGSFGPDGGIARVFVDGEEMVSVDTYSAEPRTQQVLFSKQDLRWGFHDVTIVATGEHNPASSDAWVAVDAGIVRYLGPDDGLIPVLADMARISMANSKAAGDDLFNEREDQQAKVGGKEPGETKKD